MADEKPDTRSIHNRRKLRDALHSVSAVILGAADSHERASMNAEAAAERARRIDIYAAFVERHGRLGEDFAAVLNGTAKVSAPPREPIAGERAAPVILGPCSRCQRPRTARADGTDDLLCAGCRQRQQSLASQHRLYAFQRQVLLGLVPIGFKPRCQHCGKVGCNRAPWRWCVWQGRPLCRDCRVGRRINSPQQEANHDVDGNGSQPGIRPAADGGGEPPALAG